MAEFSSGDDIATTSPARSPIPAPDRCPICCLPFTRIRRQRFCSDTCRKTAWRRRHTSPAPPAPVPPPQRRRESTVYACPECETRFLGVQFCDQCRTFCLRVGFGGLCPTCEEPVAVTDLFDPPEAPVTAR